MYKDVNYGNNLKNTNSPMHAFVHNKNKRKKGRNNHIPRNHKYYLQIYKEKVEPTLKI